MSIDAREQPEQQGAPDQPIQRPWFTCMELLILAIAPLAVAFMVALHASAPDERGPISLLGIVFMSMCAVLTCDVHFVILTLSREPTFSALPWALVVFSFRWLSISGEMRPNERQILGGR